MAAGLVLEPWGDEDLDLELRGNTPELKAYLGGVEPRDAIVARHRRALELAVNGTGQKFRIALPDAPRVGSVGYWEREWRGELVYEIGWFVLSEFQGRGVASAAVRVAVDHARSTGRLRYVHAFPKVAHGASNGVCRKAGFTLLGEVDFEYPKGTPIRSNDWRLDLRPS
jgi:RimJ/RimL family protein N-acetyltransferase